MCCYSSPFLILTYPFLFPFAFFVNLSAEFLMADPGGRAVQDVGLQLLAC
jgi:hypothetical protein